METPAAGSCQSYRAFALYHSFSAKTIPVPSNGTGSCNQTPDPTFLFQQSPRQNRMSSERGLPAWFFPSGSGDCLEKCPHRLFERSCGTTGTCNFPIPDRFPEQRRSKTMPQSRTAFPTLHLHSCLSAVRWISSCPARKPVLPEHCKYVLQGFRQDDADSFSTCLRQRYVKQPYRIPFTPIKKAVSVRTYRNGPFLPLQKSMLPSKCT